MYININMLQNNKDWIPSCKLLGTCLRDATQKAPEIASWPDGRG